jgi:hypothetical protein
MTRQRRLGRHRRRHRPGTAAVEASCHRNCSLFPGHYAICPAIGPFAVGQLSDSRGSRNRALDWACVPLTVSFVALLMMSRHHKPAEA